MQILEVFLYKEEYVQMIQLLELLDLILTTSLGALEMLGFVQLTVLL